MDTKQFLSSEETITSFSTPCPPTTESDISASDVDGGTPWTSVESVTISVFDTAPSPSSGQSTISISTPCPSTYGSVVSSSGSDSDTTRHMSTESVDSSVTVSREDTTPCVSAEEQSVSSSTPCPSTYRTDSSSTGTDVGTNTIFSASTEIGTTPYPSAEVDFSSVTVGVVDTTPCLSSEETSVSLSTTCPFTYEAGTSSIGMSSNETASLSMQVTSASTTADYTSIISVESQIFSTVDTFMGTSVVQLYESSDTSSVSRSLATSAPNYVVQSSADDLDFTSPSNLITYSEETTMVAFDTLDLLSSTTEVPPIGDSTEPFTAEDGLSTDDSHRHETMTSSAVGSTFFVDTFTQLEITTEVPFMFSDYVTTLVTGAYDSGSVSSAEAEIDTSATVKQSYSTDSVTVTSDKFAWSTSSTGASSRATSVDFIELVTFTVSPVVRVSSETLHTGTESTAVSSDTDHTVEGELGVSTDAEFASHASIEADVTSHVVITTETSTTDTTYSDKKWMYSSVSSVDDDRNMSTATTRTVVDFLPGDFVA